jgi:hypothetical protein
MTNLQDMADVAYKFACDIMVGTDKELMPMFVIVRGGENPQTEIIGCPFQDDAEKRTMVVNVALEIVEKGADAWSFLTESWFAHRKQGEPMGPRPAEDPNRKEGVICLASDGKDTQLHTWETKRHPDGRCAELVKYSAGEGPQKFESWISVALNKAKKLHDEFPGPAQRIMAAVNETIKGKTK